mgnify:CR=1 FL=1
MAAQLNDTVGIYPQQYEEKKMEERIQAILKERFGRDLDNCTKSEIFEALMVITKQEMAGRKRNTGSKKLYYISAEFLIGKLLSNNLINLGMYEEVEKALAAHGRELTEIEEMEMEPSLGNGGLGRLAACFLDSIATLGLPGDGIGLNYHFGLFRQLLVDHKQKEVKNPWITNESWLVRQPVSFAVPYKNFTMHSTLYDIDVPGYNNGCNRLHLFDVDTVDESIVPSDSINFDKHQIQKNLTLFLYPDDSDRAGQLLRIYQQYFMVSNAAQLILMEMKEKQYDLRKMYDYAVIQINDTHPSMIIPELIRILVNDKAFTMDEAIEVVSKTCAYTNHTIMSEALEKWPIELFSRLLPRVYQIVEEINRRFLIQVREQYPGDEEKVRQMAVIYDGQVHMARLAIVGGYSVNGVAQLHTEILKKQTLKDFYEMTPEKFNNKTNGITQRRFLLHGNPLLADWVTEYAGDGWITDLPKIEKIAKLADDTQAQKEFMEIKYKNKVRLAKYIKEHNGIDVDPNSIFDVQVKRLHEYKRQFMNILHIMYLYDRLKKNPDMPFYPRTFIFGAKASAGYERAKAIIKLINSVGDVVNNDPTIKGKIKVVFIEDYRVSNAELIFAAADVSEQISTASKEASGTGNMKFMLNGALTLGTMDGANVEIVEEVGKENAFIFGLSADQVIEYENNYTYDPMSYFIHDQDIHNVVMDLISGRYSNGDTMMFRDLYDSLLTPKNAPRPDMYFTLADFKSYAAAQERVEDKYRNTSAWARSAILNTAHSGKFTSDRTIQQYVDDIWHLDKITVRK